jgi:hypothetical protein
MHLLPLSLSPIANLCEKSQGVTMNGVCLRVHGDNTYRVMATNGRYGIIATGNCAGDAAEYPELPALSSSPNGEMESVVPAKEWKKAFADAKKIIGKRTNKKLHCLPVVIGKQVTSFGATNLESITFAQPRNLEGRFPSLPDVIPQADKAFATVRVDPSYLAEMLSTIAALDAEGTNSWVDIELHGKASKPATMLALRTSNEAMRVDAALVPLNVKDESKQKETDNTEADDTDSLKTRIAELERENGKLREQLNSKATASLADKDISELNRLNLVNSILQRNFDAMRQRAESAEAILRDDDKTMNHFYDDAVKRAYESQQGKVPNAEIERLENELASAQDCLADAEKEAKELHEQIEELKKDHADEMKELETAGKLADKEHAKEIDELENLLRDQDETDPHLIRSRQMYRELCAAHA